MQNKDSYHCDQIDCKRGISSRVYGVGESFAPDKNEILTGQFGSGHVRKNCAKIADLCKKTLDKNNSQFHVLHLNILAHRRSLNSVYLLHQNILMHPHSLKFRVPT